MKTLRSLATLLACTALASTASAVSLVLDPDPVSILATDFGSPTASPLDFSLLSGDSTSNQLEFGLSSPATGAIFVDQVSILFDAMVTQAFLVDADTWVGIALAVSPAGPDAALVTLLFQTPGTGTARFRIDLADTPTQATFESRVEQVTAQVRPVPEPSAAAVFAAGFAVTGLALRGRSLRSRR